MKYLVFIIFLAAFCSCHSDDKKTETVEATKDSLAEENSLIGLVKQYPDSLAPLQNLTGFYLDKERYGPALDYVNAAIRRDSTNPELWDMRSVVEVAKEDTNAAIHSLEKAVELYPGPDFIISLGALYAETKNAKALQMADALLMGDKSQADREAYFIKGLYYSYSGQKEKSIPFFDQALGVDFHFMEAYLEKALALYDLKKYEEAVTVLNKAVALQNNFDRGYYYLGRCYEKLDKKAEAINAYRKALMYDPNYDEAAEALSKLDNQ